MSKSSWRKTAIEFVVFNCLLFTIGRLMGMNIDDSNIWRRFMLIFAILAFPNIYVITFLSAIYGLNSFLKRKLHWLIGRMLVYSLASFLVSGIIAFVWIFFIPATNDGQSLYLFIINGALHNLQDSLANFATGKINLFNLFFNFCFVGIIPVLSLLLPSWIVTGGLVANFISVQTNEFKEKRKTAIVTFLSLQLSYILSSVAITCVTIDLLFIGIALTVLSLLQLAGGIVGLSMSIFPSQSISWSNFSWSNLISHFLMIAIFGWLGFSLLIETIIGMSSLVISLLSLFSNRSRIFKTIYLLVWKFLFPALQFLQFRIIPLTVFSPGSAFSYYFILKSLVFFQGRSLFIIDEVLIGENLANFTLSYIKSSQGWLFYGNKLHFLVSKLENLRIVARQMLLMGNIKQSERLYEVILEILEPQSQSTWWKLNKISSSGEIVNIIFKEIFQFCAQLNQKDIAKLLYRKIDQSLSDKSLSLITVLSIKMSYEFHFLNTNYIVSGYSDKIKMTEIGEIINYLIRYSPNAWKITKPQDLNKIVFRFVSTDNEIFNEVFKKYNGRFFRLISEVKNIFDVQEKIFSLARNPSSNFELNYEEVKKAMSEVLNFNILGIDLSFSNPFLNENNTLIPLILVQTSWDFSLEIIQDLTDRAIADNRNFDLALLCCCQGKILVDRGDVDIGFRLLHSGICNFEGIRNSVSSDQLGVGFGDGYLKFYDWAIDAAIQIGDIHQAFDYSEHAKARATLDLLCRRTSNSASEALQESLVELQNLDLSIALIDSSTYSKPYYVNILPISLHNNLRSRFYDKKNRRMQDISKKRTIIINKIDKIDPVASSLLIFKPLSWSEKSIFGDRISTYPELWQTYCITSDEAIISYHGLCNAQTARGGEWNKIVCFSLFVEDKKLHLNHFIIDNLLVVTQLQKKSQGLIKELYSRSSRSASSLIDISKVLIQPMLQDLPVHLEKLIIMGNNEFQFMPWATMYMGEDEDSMESRWLVDDFNIRVTPSLSLLLLLKQREDRRDTNIHPRFSIAGVSRYPETQRFLYWSGFETNSIAKLYNVKPIKDEAIDRQFIDEFQSSEIIHFSGHADYQVDESRNALDRTYLCLYHHNLSAAQILDGALQSSTAKVMILSACQTGTGDLVGAGSEILGLERSLFYAGVSALITTLWQVDDVATSLLMIKFHSIWKQHNNSLDYLSSSLADAQMWLKNATWQDIKYEIEDFGDAIEACIEICSTLMTDELSRNEEADISSLKKSIQYCINMKQYNENRTPFQHPYYWAAFQVKGVG